MKLYEIKDDYLGLLSLVENGDLTQEQIADTLETIDDDFHDKTKNCLMMIKHFEGQAQVAKSEAERLKALADSRAKKADEIREYVRFNMEAAKKDKMDLGIFSVTLKKPTKTVGVVDESKIPARYFRVIPESRQLDKKSLLADLKNQEVAGAELKDGKRALLIK